MHPQPSATLQSTMEYLAIVLFILFLTAFGIAFYALPALIALHREHPKSRNIAALNLTLGWTVVAWLLALAFALRPLSARELRGKS